MKTLTNLKTVVKGDEVTITGKIVEQTFSHPSQQVTVSFAADGNPHWIRQCQISHEAMFVKHLAIAFGIPLEEWVTSVASVIEPKLNHPPIFRRGASALEAVVYSELEMTIQWQVADQINGEYVDIPGATAPKLDMKLIEGNKWVRCKAESEAGWTTNTPFLVHQK